MNNLPRENIYGHTKKLRYLISHILQYADLHGGPLTLLDFGCGNGIAVSQYLIREGIRFYGVDIHDPSLEYARRHFAAEHAFFLDHIPDGVLFDIIVYADVLEHLCSLLYACFSLNIMFSSYTPPLPPFFMS